MKALLDTNVLTSYLLPSRDETAVTAVVEAAIKGVFSLLLPCELAEEFARKVESRVYLKRRIEREDASELMDLLVSVAQTIPTIAEEIPAVCRDLKDDYLLAYALVGGADYLVTGVDDLLVLGRVEGVKIVKPADFAALLRQH